MGRGESFTHACFFSLGNCLWEKGEGEERIWKGNSHPSFILKPPEKYQAALRCEVATFSFFFSRRNGGNSSRSAPPFFLQGPAAPFSSSTLPSSKPRRKIPPHSDLIQRGGFLSFQRRKKRFVLRGPKKGGGDSLSLFPLFLSGGRLRPVWQEGGRQEGGRVSRLARGCGFPAVPFCPWRGGQLPET